MKSPEQELYERGVWYGQRGSLLDDLAVSVDIFSDEHFLKGYEEGAKARYDPKTGKRYHTWDGKGLNDPKPPVKETEVEENLPLQTDEAVEICPYCGGEYDGFYCYNCEELTEDREEYKKEREEQQRRQEREGERKREIREIVERESSRKLEAVLLFPNGNGEDLRIAVIDKLNSSSRSELEFAAQLDDSPSVREAARRRLEELRLSFQQEIDMRKLEKRGTNRAKLRTLVIIARFEENPELKRNAQEQLYKYLYGDGPSFTLKYRCDRCGCEWEESNVWGKTRS